MQKQRLKQDMGLQLSPQQIQFLGLLQIPLTALEKRIEEELENNPALEEDTTPDNELSGDHSFEKKHVNNSGDFEASNMIIKEREMNLQEVLLQQLPMIILSKDAYAMAEFLIGCLDDNGFLGRSLLAITDDLLLKMGMDVSEADLMPVLKAIQTLDPPGVGARDLQECLLIQLNQKTQKDAIKTAQAILTNHYSTFSHRNHEKLMRELDIDKNTLKEAYEEIEKLNPKPGASFSNSHEATAYITPDFLLEVENENLKVTLNNSKVKRLKSSQYYKKMLSDLENENGDKDAISFLKDKIEGAHWFANALIQREQTLLNTMNCIVDLQSDFFMTGNEQLLKPMKLLDIAEKIHLDISTISRVTNSKYVDTPYGTFLLKDFFSDAFNKKDGTTISNKVVKTHLKELLDVENKKAPYSDEELAERLGQKGYHIARRTVAKYREQLGVPTARLRREL